MTDEQNYIAFMEEQSVQHDRMITELHAGLALALYSLETGKRRKGSILVLDKLKRKITTPEFIAKFKELNDQINEADKEI